MSLFLGLSLIVLVVLLACLVVNYWKNNRILKMELECKDWRLQDACAANDRYKDEVAQLELYLSKLCRESWYSKINPLPMHAMVTTSALLAAEWGGMRVGESPIDAGCSGLLLYSPAGLLFVLYPTESDGMLAHLPEASRWDWHGAKHRLICESHNQVVADLMVYAKQRQAERETGQAEDEGLRECQTGA